MNQKKWWIAEAEWSKAMILREKINKKQQIPGLYPGVGNL